MSVGRSGLVLLDKPAEMTSFEALGKLKTAAGTRRVGHTGTLDRFATGLMLVLVGPCTRLARLFNELEKSYRAVVIFGVETDTLDPEGEVAATAPVPDFATIERVAGGFTGRIEQVPPAYSALHVAGRRAHELARSGRPPEMASRMVSIYSLRLGRYDPPELELEVECSKGTYVRALARDLARAAGSRAHLSALRRTAVGPFRVEEAVTPGGFDPGRHVISPARFMSRLDGVRCQTVDPAAVQAVRYGKPLDGRFIELQGADRILALFEVDERLVAVAERDGPGYRYLAVFPEELS